MDLKQIKELMSAMEKAGMKKLTIKEKTGYELHMERQDEAVHMPVAPVSIPHSQAHFAAHIPRSQEVHPPAEEKAAKAQPEEKSGKYIPSPMVGTFYTAPSPEDPPFVKPGDRVTENTVVCIIEAMKVMNEVKAGVSGVVAEVCLENGHPVEFGTKLIRVV